MYELIATCTFFAVVIVLMWGWEFFSALTQSGRRKSRGARMIARAEKHRRTFVRNIDHDITGVCTAVSFTEGLATHNQKVESGEIKGWEKVVVYAQPTFTFAGDEQTRRPVHTGVKANLESIVGTIVMTLTGVNPEAVSARDYETAIKIIFERDSRLFVPYAGGGVSEGERQFAFYGKTTIEQAIADINQAAGL